MCIRDRIARESLLEAEALRRESDAARAEAENALDRNADAIRHAESRIENLRSAFAEAANRAASAESELSQARRSAAAGSANTEDIAAGDRETRWREAQRRQASIVSQIRRRVGAAKPSPDASSPAASSPAAAAVARSPLSSSSPSVERARAQARAALENARDVAESLESARRTPTPSKGAPRDETSATRGRKTPRDENAPPPPNGVAPEPDARA